MSPWKHKFNFADIWRREDIPQRQRLTEIAARFTGYIARLGDGEAEGLAEELTDAAANDDVDHFDAVWAAIYDWADVERVWIGTF